MISPMIEGLPKVGETLRDAEKTEKTFRERPREKQRDRAEAKKRFFGPLSRPRS